MRECKRVLCPGSGDVYVCMIPASWVCVCVCVCMYVCVPLQTTAVEDMMKNIPFFNRTQEAWLNVAQYQIGDAMAEGKYRAITDFVTLDQRLNWFSFLPILREAALLYKSEVG